MVGEGEAVRVVVRLRPEEQSTCAGGNSLAGSCVTRIEQKKITVEEPTGNSGGSSGTKDQRGRQAHYFTFDRVFRPEATQEEVFDTVRPLVNATVDGFTTTVLAYGSTGSGKTHTISGTEESPGILPRSIDLLFQRLESDAAAGSDKAFMVFLTYVELYNNVFSNLLDDIGGASRDSEAIGATRIRRSKSFGKDITPPLSPLPPKIEVREHPSRGIFLSGGKDLRVPVSSAASVAMLVSRGTKARRTAATGLNDSSSRSHAILILEIEATQASPATVATMPGHCGDTGRTSLKGSKISRRASFGDFVSTGKMQIIDLAGSERVAMSGVKGSSLVEAQNINLSLSLLGNVLNALSKFHRAESYPSSKDDVIESNQAGDAEPASPPRRGLASSAVDRPFIPYRDSKLTHLLKDSLGGNCKTLMVCAVRTAPACFQQTMVSLRYAARARDIKNVPHRVMEGEWSEGGRNGTTLRGTVDEIESLRSKLAETTAAFERLRGATTSGESEKVKLRQELKVLAEKNRSEKRRMDELLDGVIHSQKGELERRKAEFVDLQDTIDSHAATIEKQKEHIKNLQNENQAASSAASNFREQAHELSQALGRAERESTKLQEDVLSLRAEGERLRIELDSSVARVRQLEEEKGAREAARVADIENEETYRKAVKKMAKERENLKTAARGAEEHGRQTMMELEHLKKESDVLALSREEAFRSLKKGLEERTRAAENKAADMEARMTRYRDECDVARAAASDAVKTAECEKQNLEKHKNLNARAEETHRKAVKNMVKEQENLKTAVREAEEHGRKAIMELEHLKKESDALALSREEAFRSLKKGLEERTRAAENEAADMEARMTRYREERDVARAAASDAVKTAEREKQNLEEHKNLNARSEADLGALREELEARGGEISTMRESLKLLQEQKAKAEKQTGRVEEQLREMEKGLASEASNRLAAEGKVDETEQSLASVTRECEELKRSLMDATTAAAEDLSRASSNIFKLEASAISEAEKLAKAEDELDALKRCSNDEKAEIEALQVRLATQITEAEQLRVQIEATESREEDARRNASEQHGRETALLRERLDAEAAEADNMREQMTEMAAEIEDFRKQATQHQSQSAKRAEQMELLTRERDDMGMELETAHVNAAQLRIRLDEVTAEAQQVAENAALDRQNMECAHREELESRSIEVTKEATKAAETILQERFNLELSQRFAEAAENSENVLREALRRQRSEADEEHRHALELKDLEANDKLRKVLTRHEKAIEGAREISSRQNEEALKQAEVGATVLLQEREAAARDQAVALMRVELEAANVKAKQTARDLRERLAVAEEREAGTLKRQVEQLEMVNKEQETASQNESRQAREALLLMEGRAKTAEEKLFQAVGAQHQAVETDVEGPSEEAQGALTLMKQELDAYRKEALLLRSELSEVYTRSVEVARNVEAARGTATLEERNQDDTKPSGQQQEDTLTESERPGQERVDGPEQQRLTNHSIELRVEKAVYAKLKADYETAKRDIKDCQEDIASLRAKAAALKTESHSLMMELPRLRGLLEDKDVQYRELSERRRAADNRVQEEHSRASRLQRKVGRLETALSQAVSIVEQHIASAYPNSPAGLLASDSTIRVALGRNGSLGEGDDEEFVAAIDMKNGCQRAQEATVAVLTETPNDERNTQGVEAARAVLTTALLSDNGR